MECPNCEKEIKAGVDAEIVKDDDNVERIHLYLTCEHCKTELHGAVKTTVLDTI